MDSIWNYEQHANVIFGKGAIKELENIIAEKGYKNGLLVSDKYFVENGYAKELVKNIKYLNKSIFSDIEENPTVDNVDNCVDIIKSEGIDFIVSLGGGSVIDCAKAASIIALTNDSIKKYHGSGISLPQERIPLIAVPTTSGTGSEVTSVSVLTNKSLGIKAPISSKALYPEVALIDPELTYSLSPYITATTGIDVLCHAIEAFWSKKHQPISDCLSVYAASLVFKYLEKAYLNSDDKEARDKLSEASVVAGLAFNTPKTTAPHACSFPLTNIYNIPHGEACGLTLDYFTRINGSVKGSRVGEIAKRLGFSDSNKLADEIFNLKKRLGLLVDLKHLNLDNQEINILVKESRHPNIKNNPVKINSKMLLEMYTSLS